MSADSDSEDHVLSQLLEEVCEEIATGRHDADDWKRRHLEHADELPHLLGTLNQLQAAGAEWRGVVEPFATPKSIVTSGPDQVPERIGRYQVAGLIGKGGMGKVYRAIDPELEREVAIKVPQLCLGVMKESQGVERFVREARAAARVRHPHVCPIYDVSTEDGVPYVVMAFIEGRSLASQLREAGPYRDVTVAAGVVCQIADAMAAIHEHGILHRDLKPANILLDKQGQAFLTDFGLARLEMESSRLTGEGTILGTPPYMAPEQLHAQADKIGPPTDIYSLGVVLYESLTGRLPFTGDLLSLMHRPMDSKPPSVRETNPGVPPEVGMVVDIALSAQPADRFPNMAAFADALRNSVSGVAPVRQPRRQSVSRWFAIAGGAALVALVAAWLYSQEYFTRTHNDPADPGGLMAKAMAAGRQGRFAEVIRLTTEALERDPDNAAIHEVRGRAYNEIGEFNKAVIDFTNALTRDPTMVQAYVHRSQAYVSLHNYQAAIDDATKGLEFAATDKRSRISMCANRGWALACLAKYDDALRDYDEVVQLDSGNPRGYWQRAVILEHANRQADADRDRAKAIALDKTLKDKPPPTLE